MNIERESNPPLPWPESLASTFRRLKGEQAYRELLGHEENLVTRLARGLGITKNLARSENNTSEEEIDALMQKVEILRAAVLERGSFSEDDILVGFPWATHTRLLEEGRIKISSDPDMWEEDADYFRLVIDNPGFQLYFSLKFNKSYNLTIEFPTYLMDQRTLSYVVDGHQLETITKEESTSVNYYLTSALDYFT